MIRSSFELGVYVPTLLRHGEGCRRCRGSHHIRVRFHSEPLWRWEDEEDAGKWGEDTTDWEYDEIRWEARLPRWKDWPAIVPGIRTNRHRHDQWCGPYAIKKIWIDWLYFHWTIEIMPDDKGLPAR